MCTSFTCCLQGGTQPQVHPRFYTDTYDALLDKKLKCENATNTPFKNEELCHEKICEYHDKKIACDMKQASCLGPCGMPLLILGIRFLLTPAAFCVRRRSRTALAACIRSTPASSTQSAMARRHRQYRGGGVGKASNDCAARSREHKNSLRIPKSAPAGRAVLLCGHTGRGERSHVQGRMRQSTYQERSASESVG